MKKLMIAAAVAALAGVTFAGNVFEYKASVKYTNLKKATVKIREISVTGYIKVLKTASLTGWLVADPDCPCTVYQQLPKNGMLVVQNKGVKSGVKMLPANLLVQVCQTAAKKYLAEGYLFAGDGTIAGVKAEAAAEQKFGSLKTVMTKKLFGAYNTPMADGTFYDAWLDAAGFGAAKVGADEEEGCDLILGDLCLVNLAGSVIGGCFMCHAADLWREVFLCQNWQYTTSVVSGTWSIKETSKIKEVALTNAEIALTADTKFVRLVKGAAQNVANNKNWAYTDIETDLTTENFNTLFLKH